jgi:hypothetical protein
MVAPYADFLATVAKSPPISAELYYSSFFAG